ncbi:putative S-adenosylmethionine-dependent methyltransferase [Natrialba magadii ATCC 43099]|uniref:S-adenosylmethionine-dependent methyltransferase n=1 Tax=Natrialba magadii (strain ATCC 43099 / DSM 3394 / CCM 3739 / CIP 104546 / IAM 13178 / JCM 8861 / NBRC 102185 / NCIMB 2190 / MS3) TaxID=547559 RepID=D3SWD9_NATMM|nr:class I SAM-dependent methyltransferase [Natrialba magadii]ADD03731.1 putative S-adenosylmethionine-dependent methyltransferase [Natrialba magadii ATCC 43099]ELY33786.1 type 11 methyltransferase [Natrialba magadii ATCC 43099]
MEDENGFEYSSEMKEYYKSDNVATKYHEAFSDDGSWRHKLIAKRERNAIETLLRKVPHETVLDIPTGTGKLAPVFADAGSDVLACDISENMLQIAETEYERAGISDARFQVCDAEEITETIDESFDVAVSLRLLHRVPTEVKRNILTELGRVADYVIASTAIETQFHSFRRDVRQSVLGGDERDHCYESPETTQEIFSDGFEIISSKRVLPVLSQERVYLLQPVE